MIARRHTRQAILVGCGLLDDINGILDDGVYLGVVLLHVTLTKLEERALGLLHEVVDIDGLVEGLGLDVARELNELAGQRLLGNDAGVVFNVGRRCHATADFSHIARSAYILQVALLGQLLGNGPHIDRQFVHGQLHDGLIDLLVAGFIETLGSQHLAHDGIGVLVYHQGTQHSTFYLGSLWLYVSIGRVDRLLLSATTLRCIVVLFCHIRSEK